MLRNSKGFTLVEMIVVMAVFIVVIVISGEVFQTVLQQTSKVFRSEESNIEGIVGLEVFRHDLQQAGYGLFTEPLCTAYTGEAAAVPASTYNEVARLIDDPCSPPESPVPALRVPPRALVAGNNLSGVADSTSESGKTYNVLVGSDYLALKGLTLGRNIASQKWTYLTQDSSGAIPKIWASGAENLKDADKVLLMRRSLTQTTKTLAIVPGSSSSFYTAFSNTAFSKYSTNASDYVIYGLNGNSTTQMPFNRSDYFVARPSTVGAVPALCAPNVGTLYKTTVDQGDGKLTYLPLLDCVADMQVVLGWDLTIGNTTSLGQDGLIDTWSSPDAQFRFGSAAQADVEAAMADPKLLASALKIVKVYILAQIGRKDPGYTSPSPITVGDSGELSITRNYVLSADKLNYRWKVYRIVVRPKNLVSNQ